MLIIRRKKDQKIIVADDIEITILEVGRNRVRFGIKAPKHITIHAHIKNAPDAGNIEVAEAEEGLQRAAVVRDFPIAVGMSKRH